MYYTYAYLREDKTPYYIGRGKHHSGYKYHRMTQKHTCGIPPQERRLILKDNLSKEQAIKHEEYMIDLFGLVWDETGVLRNHVRDSRGGSCKGRKLSEETKQKISERKKKNPRVKQHSEETKEKQKKASTGRPQSEETKQKRSESIKRWWTEKKLAQDP